MQNQNKKKKQILVICIVVLIVVFILLLMFLRSCQCSKPPPDEKETTETNVLDFTPNNESSDSIRMVKIMKKVIAMLAAIVLMMSVTVTAFAEDLSAGNGESEIRTHIYSSYNITIPAVIDLANSIL